MSNEETSGFRRIIDQRPLDVNAADYFLERSPECNCEGAEPVPGGYGAIADNEIVSMYIGSPRHTRERFKDLTTEEGKKFPYKGNLFDAIFGGGLSIMREEKANDGEVIIQAEKIAAGLKNDNPDGGIFSVLQFTAETVRAVMEPDGGTRCFCLYDTPIDVGVPGSEVLSHADIFPGGTIGSTARMLRTQRRVQIRNAIARQYEELLVEDYRAHLLKPWQAAPSLGC